MCIPTYTLVMFVVTVSFLSGILLALVASLMLVMLLKGDNKGPSIDTKHLVDTDHLIEHLWDSPS